MERVSGSPAESRYYRLEFVKLDLDDGRTGIAVGFRDVDAVVRNSLEAGMNEHLSKPVDSDLLFKSLRWHIANQDESG